MTNQPKLILVTGATGQQGGAVAHRLLQQGQKIRVLTRHPDKAAELTVQGAEVVQGDLTDPSSLSAALRGMQGVFAMSTPFEAGMEAEIAQGITMAEAAKKAEVDHYVYSSVAGADRHTGIPHFESKWKIEQHIRELGLPATILRPAFFMENFSASGMHDSILQGTLAMPLRPTTKLQMVAAHDIAEFVAAAFLRPEEFIGRTIELAGDALTMSEIADRLSRAMDRPIAFRSLPDDEVEKTSGSDMAAMFRWFNETGYSVDIPALRRLYGIPLTTFDELLAIAGWAKGKA